MNPGDPLLRLNDSDQNWILALANTLHQIDRGEALREMIQLVARALIKHQKPKLFGEELDDAVSEEIFERVVSSYSDTSTYELIAMAKDVDPDLDIWLFGEGEDYVNSILVSDSELPAVAGQAYRGALDYLSVNPERGLVHPREFTKWYPPPRDEDEEYNWIVGDFGSMIRQRRNHVILGLIEACTTSNQNVKHRD